MASVTLIVRLEGKAAEIPELAQSIAAELLARSGVVSATVQMHPEPSTRTSYRVTQGLRVVAAAVLAIDAENPDEIYGYTVRRRCEATGTNVYQTLQRMLELGWLSITGIAQRDTAPARKLYRPTPEGRVAMTALASGQKPAR